MRWPTCPPAIARRRLIARRPLGVVEGLQSRLRVLALDPVQQSLLDRLLGDVASRLTTGQVDAKLVSGLHRCRASVSLAAR